CQAIVRREKVAAAEDGTLTNMLLYLPQKIPAAWSDVFLLDRPPVHRNRRNAHGESAIEDRKEVFAALLGIVEPAAHFHGNGNIRRHRVARAANNFECNIGLTQVISATAAPQHLLHWATKIDVDHIKTSFHEL